MKMLRAACVSVMVCVGLAGCAGTGGTRVVPVASPATAARFDAMKKLAGRWENTETEPGQPPAVCEFKVVAGGSVLVETMLPGTPYEMVNTYSMDGNDIVATHYCAMGNQPRMKLDGGSDTDFPFVNTGVTNLHKAGGDSMLDVRIEMKGPDAYTATWRGRADGKIGEHAVFRMKRIK